MSSPASPNKPRTGVGWLMHSPVADGPPLPLNEDDTVTIVVNDNNVGNSGYLAGIYDDGDPVPDPDDCTPLDDPPEGSTFFSGDLDVDVPPCQKNVIVYNADDTTDTLTTAFSIIGGSCGSGSQKDAAQGAASLKDTVRPGRPVPASVSAEFGEPGAGGSQIRAAVLVYSGAPGFERCWLSQPVEGRSDGADPALWVLERRDAFTWLLRLRRGVLDLVVYRHTSAVEKDGSLPVRLHVEGDAGGGVEWPRTVTISPAP